MRKEQKTAGKLLRKSEREREKEASLALATAAIVQSQLIVAEQVLFCSKKKKENCQTGIVPSSRPITRLHVQPVV